MKDEKEWVDQLYEVRCEPDKLLIMITNRRQQLKNAALAELEKPAEDDLPCFLNTCQFYDDKEFPENCVAESGGEPAIATCVKYLKASKIVIAYHAKKCAECKKTTQKCVLCGDPITVGVCENCVPEIIKNA